MMALLSEAGGSSLNFVDIADLFVKILIGIAGLYLANSLWRQQQMRIVEKKLTAYQALWSKMEVASPFRQTVWKMEPLTRKERQKLFEAFTRWYYKDGNGMFMGDGTRAIYLLAKDNLVRELAFYRPESLRDRMVNLPEKEQERARGLLSIRQLSLLRNRMKAELGVFGIPYHVNLNCLDEDFLRECKQDPKKKPWNKKEPWYKWRPWKKAKGEEEINRQEVIIFPGSCEGKETQAKHIPS